jgi:hypothetical protein
LDVRTPEDEMNRIVTSEDLNSSSREVVPLQTLGGIKSEGLIQLLFLMYVQQ